MPMPMPMTLLWTILWSWFCSASLGFGSSALL